jgi:cytosine/creatinine deaminase
MDIPICATRRSGQMADADHAYLDLAIAQALIGRSEGGIPIGAVLAGPRGVLGLGHNRRVQSGSPVLHAEMDALANAGRLKSADYLSATMYTTLSPCSMCSGAILLYKIPRVIVGENSTFVGEEELLHSRGVAITVIGSAKCAELMRDFIAERPGLWAEDIGTAEQDMRAAGPSA